MLSGALQRMVVLSLPRVHAVSRMVSRTLFQVKVVSGSHARRPLAGLSGSQPQLCALRLCMPLCFYDSDCDQTPSVTHHDPSHAQGLMSRWPAATRAVRLTVCSPELLRLNQLTVASGSGAGRLRRRVNRRVNHASCIRLSPPFPRPKASGYAKAGGRRWLGSISQVPTDSRPHCCS